MEARALFVGTNPVNPGKEVERLGPNPSGLEVMVNRQYLCHQQVPHSSSRALGIAGTTGVSEVPSYVTVPSPDDLYLPRTANTQKGDPANKEGRLENRDSKKRGVCNAQEGAIRSGPSHASLCVSAGREWESSERKDCMALVLIVDDGKPEKPGDLPTYLDRQRLMG